jgi:hypothetical protein
MTLIDKTYGYRKADDYYIAHNIDRNLDESKIIVITLRMFKDLFLFLAAGYLFCWSIFFIEKIRFYFKNTFNAVMNSKTY